MSRPQVYKLLRNLESRNMIAATLQYPTLYGAVSIDKVLDFCIKEKQRDTFLLRRARKEIRKKMGAPPKKGQMNQVEKFAILKGKNKIYSRILQMAEETKHEFLILDNGSKSAKSFQLDFDHILLRVDKRKNALAFVLIQDPSIGGKELMEVMRQHAISEKNCRLSCRLLGDYPRFCMRFLVRDIEEAVFFTELPGDPFCQSEVAVWTNSLAVVNVLRTLFERLWVDANSVPLLELLVGHGLPKQIYPEIEKQDAGKGLGEPSGGGLLG